MATPDWEHEKQIAIEAFENFQKSKVDNCLTCGEGSPKEECPRSQFACGHHCNCSWIFDKCCWCGAIFGDEDDPEFGVPKIER